MNDSIIGVYGASGFGREVMPLIKAQVLCDALAEEPSLVFVDDNLGGEVLNGYKVLSYADFLQANASKRYVVLAIANSITRERLAKQCAADDIHPWSTQAENVVQLDEVTIQPGSILCPFVMLTSNVRVGQYFHANIYSYVAHDCVIGDFVTFAPGVKCNGNVIVHDHAYIGTGAIIKQGEPGKPLVIGQGAVIGMGAVVTRDVPAGTTVIGNPARPFVKK